MVCPSEGCRRRPQRVGVLSGPLDQKAQGWAVLTPESIGPKSGQTSGPGAVARPIRPSWNVPTSRNGNRRQPNPFHTREVAGSSPPGGAGQSVFVPRWTTSAQHRPVSRYRSGVGSRARSSVELFRWACRVREVASGYEPSEPKQAVAGSSEPSEDNHRRNAEVRAGVQSCG
jgi:hypothetical protein